MIYIVSGDGPRCGSSMMMKALVCGGMECRFDQLEEYYATAAATADYHPNPGGRFELAEGRQFLEKDFPNPAEYGGRAIKLFGTPWGNLEGIRAGEYKLVWLHRPAEERWASFKRAHQDQDMELCRNSEAQKHRDDRVRQSLGIMRQRRDVEIVEVGYGDVLKDPGGFFRALEDRGWPIDPERAASIPSPEYKRF